ncbi:MAG: hypothetical protein R3B93_28110 [Bacteroidia bacterium]
MTEMISHNGIIELGTIENTGDNADQMGILHAQFVHYPDCQQLQVWLPEYGRSGYGSYRIIDKNTQVIIENALVEDKLNGSIKMLFDTLGLPDSNYMLEIDHPKGGKHILHFQKIAEYSMPEKPIEPVPLKSDTQWKVYKDGFGNLIPNEDQILRENAQKQFMEKFNANMPDVTITQFEIAPDLKLDKDIINQALAFSTEWGQNFRKPIHDRMKQKYPELSLETIDILQTCVRKVEYFIYHLAEQCCLGKIKEAEIQTNTHRQYPWISDHNASRLAGIGMFYAMK